MLRHNLSIILSWPGTHSVVQAGGQGGHQWGNKTRFRLFALFFSFFEILLYSPD